MWFFPKVLVLFVTLLSTGLCMDNLRVAFQWRILDFDYPSEEIRSQAIQRKEFIPENNLPLGLEVYKDRVFVTVPRWKAGVAASLAYINLNDTDQSPKLIPYPNWEAHALPPPSASTPDPQSTTSNEPEIVSPFRIRADQCGRLWVLDTGLADILGETHVYAPTQLLVYDLHNDALLRRYRLPEDQVKADSFFANIAVEDNDCDNSFAYLGDLGSAGLVVYSWQRQSSWRIHHNFFHIDPTEGEFNVTGISFEWSDALFGLALSNPDPRGFSTLYFHPLTSTNEFAVSTRILQDERLAKNSYSEFRLLGSRGPKAQSGVSFLHKKTGVLFYALINLNAIACWKTTNPAYTMQSQGRVYMSNETMVFPNDIKVDANDNLWVLSDRLPSYMYKELDYNEVNFRILTESVADAIKNTACDAKLVIPGVAPPKPKTTKPPLTTNVNQQDSGAHIAASGGAVLIVTLAIMMCFN